MKKSAANDKLIITLARRVGHAAGTIVKATQGFAAAAADIQLDNLPEKPVRPRTRRSVPRKKSATPRARKRSAKVAAIKTKRRTT